MFETKTTKVLLTVAEVLGMTGLAIGLILFGISFKAATMLSPIVGVSVFASGFSCLLAAHLGRALVHIAETNSAILKKLSEKS